MKTLTENTLCILEEVNFFFLTWEEQLGEYMSGNNEQVLLCI